jgi:hypothetical protein
MAAHRSRRLHLAAFVLVVAATFVGEAFADDLSFSRPGCAPCPSDLERRFAEGGVGELPVGLGRGRVLFVCDARFPAFRARLQGLPWKGKVFDCDGRFVNQWLGFRAIGSHATVGPSWLDGRPCIVLEYAPGTPIFGNTRDELREICPGVFLGRFYERCPCPKLGGYFVLDFRCGGR